VIGVGDDAAVAVTSGATATSVDAIVDGVHFQRRWCPPEAIGERALNTALSDLAAMGAAPAVPGHFRKRLFGPRSSLKCFLAPQAVGAVGKWESWFWISTFPRPTFRLAVQLFFDRY